MRYGFGNQPYTLPPPDVLPSQGWQRYEPAVGPYLRPATGDEVDRYLAVAKWNERQSGRRER